MKLLLKNWLFKNKIISSHYKLSLGLKTKGLFVLYLSVFVSAKAQQNFAPNPSFEDTINCPDLGQIAAITNWYSPTTGTPDIYHECANRVPSNGVGFQYAKDGKCYSGVYTYAFSTTDGREYLQLQLTNSLSLGVQYCVSFYVSLSDSSRYATDNFGALITATAVSSSDFYFLPYSPQINNPSGSILQDKNSWTKISGNYTAVGGEQYLTIGNFSDDINTDTLFVGPLFNSFTYSFAYYYVDAISVIPSNLSVNAGNDTTLILGDSIYIGQGIVNFNCNWYDSSGTLIGSDLSGIYVQPLISTYYVVEQNLCGAITYDTVNVNVSGVGINENDKEIQINLYPNPNDGEFKIEYEGLGKNDVLIEITDIIGRIVYSENLQLINGMSNIKLDMGSGVYFVYIANPHTNESVVKRIVIQK